MSERSSADELKPSEVAEMLGVDPTTVRSWIRDGILPARRTRPQVGRARAPGHWRVRREDVEALRQQPSYQPDARVLKRTVQEDLTPPPS
jgi:excisionase family DNA binding protein